MQVLPGNLPGIHVDLTLTIKTEQNTTEDQVHPLLATPFPAARPTQKYMCSPGTTNNIREWPEDHDKGQKALIWPPNAQ